MRLGSGNQNDLEDPQICQIYNEDLASEVFLGKRFRMMTLMMMRRRTEAVLIWKRERHAQWTIVPDKQYSYCKTKLGCQAQNALGEAFQLHNRWRSVQDSLVHFRRKSLC